MDHKFFQPTRHNYVQTFMEGEDYYKHFLSLIRSAKRIIHLQTYIFWTDEFGSLVFEELLKAAARKVQVYVVVDSVGSRLLPKEKEETLLKAGVHFVRFNSPRFAWLYRWGRRLHHKILIIDDEVAIIGGINVVNSHNKLTGESNLDFALYLKGPVLPRLSLYCQNIFNKSTNRKISYPKLHSAHGFPDGIEVKILINDWVFRRWQITRDYRKLTQKAKSEIIIINSYFFPRKSFMKQLVEARKRGVRVRLILPKYSDWPSYILATEYLYNFLLKNEVEIYLWTKSVHHGKMALIDNQWVTVGSFNLNYTSYQQNLEMNVNVYSTKFASDIRTMIDDIIIPGCEKLDIHEFHAVSFMVRLKRFVYYIILSFIAHFSVGLSYQEDKNKENRFYNLLRITGALLFLALGVVGSLIPSLPSLPFFILSFLLIYKQILQNNKREAM